MNRFQIWKTTMANQTPLFATHLAMDAKMTYFSGWDMPLHYGSQIEEHHRVRQDAGMFDLSHLTRLEVEGAEALEFLQYLLTNDVARLEPGGMLYSCMLNKAGGILDDLVVYERGGDGFRLILNAATRNKVLAWMQEQARRFTVAIHPRDDLAIIAVQGPQAIARLQPILGGGQALASLARFHFREQDGLWIARLGYTGEDGVEITLPAVRVVELWQALRSAGVQPCGLGARDTLRIEAGFPLYGNEIDQTTTPLVCGLDWSVAWTPSDRDFSGRAALNKQRREEVRQALRGLVLEGRGVLRALQRVIAPNGDTGIVTSGTFSPTLERSIGLARVPVNIGDRCQVDVRHKYCSAWVVMPPFVRHGRVLIDLPS
jgi:aminomethyltransferase